MFERRGRARRPPGGSPRKALPPGTIAIPRFPAMAGYTVLAQNLERLGLRHIADLLGPESVAADVDDDPGDATGRPHFRVLDGLWVRHAVRWHRVDRLFLAEVRLRRQSAGAPGDLALDSIDRLDAAAAADPMGLRRILLYQLEAGLRGHSLGSTAEAAALLGVDPQEAGVLAASVTAAGEWRRDAREAAEQIADAWRDAEVREAADHVGRIPAGHGDQVLERLTAQVLARREELDRLLDAGRRRLAAGAPEQAAAAFLGAVSLAPGDPAAQRGLIRAAVEYADSPAAPDGPVRATPGPDSVVVSCAPAERPASGGSALRYRVLRLSGAGYGDAEQVADDLDQPRFADRTVPHGRPVRYVVLPIRDRRVCGTARASRTVRLTPEVSAVVSRLVPEGVRASWTTPDTAEKVRTTRRAAGADAGTSIGIGCTDSGFIDAGFIDTGLPPGDYRYLVQCGYAGDDGRTVWSAGHEIEAGVRRWPTPVPRVEVEPVGRSARRIRVSWVAPVRGTECLVRWPFPPREPGADVSDLLGRLTAESLRPVSPGHDADGGRPGGGVLRSAEVEARIGGSNRYMAISVLGDLAVAGPTVLVQTPGAVSDLAIHRIDSDHADVYFSWPEPAVLVVIGLERDGRRMERRVARSAQSGRPVRLHVGAGECAVTVRPVCRPDADLVFAGTASASLPALPRREPAAIGRRRLSAPVPSGGRRPDPHSYPDPGADYALPEIGLSRRRWWDPRRWADPRRWPRPGRGRHGR